MLSAVEPWNLVAEGYAKTTMGYFQGYIDRAIQLANLASHHRILDVACGPGTLSLTAAKHVDFVNAIDFSEAMIAILNQFISNRNINNIETVHGDGQDLPYDNTVFDVAFSMFGLMFFPDRNKGYAEIHRTLKPGGKIIVSSWAPVSQSPLMQILFEALRAINPDMPAPESDINSLENPDFFADELQQAGFKDVEIHSTTQAFPVESAEAFWNDMVIGSAPIVMLKHSMSPDQWAEKEKCALASLKQNLAEVPTTLSSNAWIGIGIKK